MSKSAANLARNTATADQNNATSLEGTLQPIYARMAAGKPTPGSIAATTAAGQSAGGSEAGAVGQLGLNAARTRNAAGFAPAADQAARTAGHDLSQNALDIAQQNQDTGLRGLGGLYGTNADNSLKALDLYNNASNSTFWNQLGGAIAAPLGKAIGGGIGGLFGKIPGMGGGGSGSGGGG